MPSRPTITIRYELKPPANIDTGVLAASKAESFEIKARSQEGQKVYYKALQDAIAEARSRVGEDLTAWRDCVGKAELTKEPKQKDDEGDDEEDEEGDDHP